MVIKEGVPHESDDAVEFRSTTDDAWHAVLLNLAVNILFINFVEVETTKKREVYGSLHFDTLGEVEDFRMRFRPFCEPVWNDDCTDVKVGMTVSVANNFGNDDWRSYDGVVKSVNPVKHQVTYMEIEECCCEFRIFWKHGPLGGTVTTTRLKNIQLLVPNTEIHPALSAFLDITRQRFQIPGKSNDRDDIMMLEAQPSPAIHGDSLTNIWKMQSGEIPRARETEKPLRMPGLFERKLTMSSSLPPLLSSFDGIGSNHGTNIEFRSLRDDAWHGVSLRVTSEGKLVLNYDDYTMFGVEEAHDPDEFNTLGEIEDFRERFRPLSLHLSPRECHEVEMGNLVSVRYEFKGTEESRFYDSVVKEVIRYQHALLDEVEEETCFCSFEIFWKHGPEGGTVSTASIDHICATVPTIETHPVLASFLDMARRELGRPKKHARIDGQNPNLPPGDIHGDMTLSKGEPSTRDKGKKIVTNFSSISI